MRLALRIVNLLEKNKKQLFTMNEIAKALGETYSHVQRVMTQLISEEVIMKKVVGHAFQCFLNKNSATAKALASLYRASYREGHMQHYEQQRRLRHSRVYITQIQKKMIPLLKQHHVKKAALFGSCVRGDMKRGSDIDVLVELDKSTGLLDFVGLKLELEEVLNKKVDLVEYTTLKPLLRERILKEQRVIYGT